MDGPDAGSGGRGTAAEIGPGVEGVEGIDDTPAKLAVGGARSIAGVLFEGSGRKSDVKRGIGRLQIARRGQIGHGQLLRGAGPNKKDRRVVARRGAKAAARGSG